MNDSIITPMKRCTKCGIEKPATTEYFHKLNRTIDGISTQCKNCVNMQRKIRYDKNPSTALNSNREYRQRNREAVSERKKEYRQRNKDRIRANRKELYSRTREESIEASKEYYHENRQEIRVRRRKADDLYNKTHREQKQQWARNYYKEYPEKATAVFHRRAARKRELPATLSGTQWKKCLEYFNHRCAVCGRPRGMWHTIAADHWIPLISPDCLGTVAGNMIPLCHGDGGCNNSKGGKDAILWLNEKFGKKKAKQILDRINTYFEWVKQQND
jgi:hypothetical protein